ncbi:MAG: glycosyltransferase family 4 protein [Burkholderiaceae bacterium]
MNLPPPPTIACLIPGNPDTRTGGYLYDARLIAGLRETGLALRVTPLSDRFPTPDAAALAHADEVLGALPAGSVVLIDGLAFGAMAEVASRHAGRLRLIALVHHPLALETGLSPQQSAAFEAGERRALACATRVLVTSETTRHSVMALGVPAARITVAEPGCDVAPLAQASARTDQRDDSSRCCRMLCVGTLTPRKGHEILLRALAQLQARRQGRVGQAQTGSPVRDAAVPTATATATATATVDDARRDWQLQCVGSPTRDAGTAARILQLTMQLGLADRIQFCGEVGDDELRMLYARADLFVCASWWEGYGMAVAEALAHGLPLITTTGGALAHTAPQQASLQVAPGDIEGLGTAIEGFLDDPRCASASTAARATRA